MSDESDSHKVTLSLQWKDFASANLNARISELRNQDKHVELDHSVKAIQFLRGASSRATFVLPALYQHVGAGMFLQDLKAPYWERVHASSIEFCSLLSISLTCRAVFDDSRTGMTGKNFAKISDPDLNSVAEYWSRESQRPIEEAAKALKLLRKLFERCAHQPKSLFDAPSLLERRVGLLKYHADRQAAHITLQPFLFHLLDLIHVVAVIAVVGAMIIAFDDKTRGEKYFNSIDEAAWNAAKASFPNLPGDRLFHNFNIHEQAELYWKIEALDGLNMLLNQLPSALGYWDSSKDTQRP